MRSRHSPASKRQRSKETMEAIDHLTGIARCDKDGSGPKSRARETGIDAELRFLKSNAPAPFLLRLARELAEAARAIVCDPAAFIAGINPTGSMSRENRKRI